MWAGILLIIVGAALLTLILWKPTKVSSPEEEEKFEKESNTDSSEMAMAIKQAVTKTNLNAKLLSNIKVKGWTKHSATIDYLLLSTQGVILFRKETFSAKSVRTKGKRWFFETDNSKKEMKNPVNMNNYAINILRNLLKDKCKSSYDKINFTSVIVFNDDTEIKLPKKEKEGVVIIKQNKIADLIEMIAGNSPALSSSDLNCIDNAIRLAVL